MRIGIVGAGLSGRLLALNLLRHASPPRRVDIVMFDRGAEPYMGPAYSNETDRHLLNVPACRMGAYPEDPEHFLRWLQGRDARVGPWDFVPRVKYREYLLTLVQEAMKSAAGAATLEHVRGEVIDMAADDGGVAIHLDHQGVLEVDKAVLALGNFPPRHPKIETLPSLTSTRYVRDPWDAGAIEGLNEHDTVFLIGTGQTTVDLAVALHRRGHRGQIVAISRRGYLPLGHRGFESYPSFLAEIQAVRGVRALVRIVREHLQRADAAGIDRRAVIDSLRPHTQEIWSALAEDEKRRFLRHAFRFWEIIRSRLPAESEAHIRTLRDCGQLRIVAGRIQDLVETGPGMAVRYVARGGTAIEVESAARVINCIGPESDYERVEHPLVRNLLRSRRIRSGPAGLGVDASPDGAIIDAAGIGSEVLFTLGSTMKGVLWEVVAVPEIRVQAERLARLLLDGTSRPTPDSTGSRQP
ncbi:MAG TPA: FAD/NAD(P)-binding protein [Xanthomonadaceae bacterium]|nr:FAD/NAD(P)-binding protein [Xanthomonadaceae bacterium]